jgi:SAM-dependent methyltransferase
VADAPDLDAVRRDYDRVADRYNEFVHDPLAAEPFTCALIGAFADLVRALSDTQEVADLGCGPGHLTDFLSQLGLPARGIDLSPALIDIARRNRSDLAFEVGSILDLDIADCSLGGVLAHYSTIHTPPEHVPTAFAEFARVITSGGYILLAFQSGDDTLDGWEAFDHKVSPAYRWSIDTLADLLRVAGLIEIARLRVQPRAMESFPAGVLLARKFAAAATPR